MRELAEGLMGPTIRAWRIRPEAVALCWKAREALIEQAGEWDTLPFLERQHMLLEFRVRAGCSVDEWFETLERIVRELIAGPGGHVEPAPLDRLAAFYDHLGDLDRASAIEPVWREHELRDVDQRAADVRRLADLLEPVHAVSAPVARRSPARGS